MEKRGQACGAEQVVWMAVSRWTHRGRTAAVHKYVGTQVQVEGQGERAPVACLRVEGGDVPAKHGRDAEGAWSGFGLGFGFRVRVSGLGLRVRVRGWVAPRCSTPRAEIPDNHPPQVRSYPPTPGASTCWARRTRACRPPWCARARTASPSSARARRAISPCISLYPPYISPISPSSARARRAPTCTRARRKPSHLPKRYP